MRTLTTHLLAALLCLCGLLLPAVPPAQAAADLTVSQVSLEPCPRDDIGAQPQLRRPSGASCYVLRGTEIGRAHV